MSREGVEAEVVRMRLRLAEIAERAVLNGLTREEANRVRTVLRVSKGLLNEVEDRTLALMDEGALGKKSGRARLKEALLFGWCVVETAAFESVERRDIEARVDPDPDLPW